MDCLPLGWLDRRLRLFLLLLLFLLQNQNVWILPDHFLLWLHGRLQPGSWDAVRHGWSIVKVNWFILMFMFVQIGYLGTSIFVRKIYATVKID